MDGGGRVGITANGVNCNRADGLLLTGLTRPVEAPPVDQSRYFRPIEAHP
jgi:hypothetical protein